MGHPAGTGRCVQPDQHAPFRQPGRFLSGKRHNSRSDRGQRPIVQYRHQQQLRGRYGRCPTGRLFRSRPWKPDDLARGKREVLGMESCNTLVLVHALGSGAAASAGVHRKTHLRTEMSFLQPFAVHLSRALVSPAAGEGCLPRSIAARPSGALRCDKTSRLGLPAVGSLQKTRISR
jgi:hypothetical protein